MVDNYSHLKKCADQGISLWLARYREKFWKWVSVPQESTGVSRWEWVPAPLQRWQMPINCPLDGSPKPPPCLVAPEASFCSCRVFRQLSAAPQRPGLILQTSRALLAYKSQVPNPSCDTDLYRIWQCSDIWRLMVQCDQCAAGFMSHAQRDL